MASTAVHACFFIDDTAPAVATGSAADLIKLYGPRLTGEIGRLRVNLDREVHVSFSTGIAYMQCEPETKPAAIYCEAESADSWPAISALLTPDHIAKLHAAGYADPGRAPNYWKLYPLDDVQDADVASEVLTLLHDVYGYTGAEPLLIETEKGKAP